jgi:hypothetical protein
MSANSTGSILHCRPNAVATLANKHALDDLKLLFKTIEIWNESPPTMYIYCSSDVLNSMPPYAGKVIPKVTLDAYANYTRAQMENKPSKCGLKNLFHDFTQEKCGLMKWALESLSDEDRIKGVLFCDADIFWLGPLPMIPIQATLGLSQHGIRKEDEAKFGEYNAGFLWTNDLTMPAAWKKACTTSRFFEQAALEDLADATPEDKLYLFPEQYNYGWWRIYQNVDPSLSVRDWSQFGWSFRQELCTDDSGILVKDVPLACVHTHWKTTDAITNLFNNMLRAWLKKAVNGNNHAKLRLLNQLIYDS